MTASIPALKAQLQQLRELHDSGVLPADQYAQGKDLLEHRILEAVMSEAPQTSAASRSDPAPAAAIPGPETATAAPAAKVKPSRVMLALLVVLVLGVAAGGYLWKRGGEVQNEAAARAEIGRAHV